MLDFLAQTETIGSGQVLEALLDGQYRVLFRGRRTVARSQAGQLSAGQPVTIASTAAGLVIVSAGSAVSTNHVEVLING